MNTTPPTVSGTPKQGRTLQGNPGAWTVDEGDIALTYQWLRCTGTTLASCAPIAGATGPAYTVQKADRDRYLRFQVTAHATGGDTVAVSPAVPVK